MRRRVLASAAAWVASFACVLAPGAHGQQPATPPAGRDSIRVALVTYVSGQSVYVGAGRDDGVREGTTLEVFRGAAVIATLRATYLSSHSSSGEIVTSTAAPNVGDSVRYHPKFDATTIALADSMQGDTSAAPRTTSAPWRRPIRGHIGLGYLGVSQPNGDGAASLQEPSTDVYLEATNIGGSPVGVVIDSRTRHTIGAAQTDALSNRTVIYQMALAAADPRSGARLSVGRQYSAALSSVSLFDGVTAELNRSQWGVGAFGGLQPDPTSMGYSSAVREGGGYVQVHNQPDDAFPWSVTTGGVDSRDLGELNREFGFAQVTLNSSVVSLFATQEVDVNRGWKRAAGEPAVSPTSTFATIAVRPNDAISFDGGFDNRRNVRLYRDYVNPVTQFDDAYREGAWAGASARLFPALRLGADARVSRGGPAGGADYYTGSLDVGRVWTPGLEAHLRATKYTTDWSAGWLNSWSLSVDPFGVARFEVNGGVRTERDVVRDTSVASLPPVPGLGGAWWFGASVDVNLGRSFYLMLSGVRDGSGTELTNQLYSSLVFRF
jgi:hypothetical protein